MGKRGDFYLVKPVWYHGTEGCHGRRKKNRKRKERTAGKNFDRVEWAWRQKNRERKEKKKKGGKKIVTVILKRGKKNYQN